MITTRLNHSVLRQPFIQNYRLSDFTFIPAIKGHLIFYTKMQIYFINFGAG